jgi:hypothetical protein
VRSGSSAVPAMPGDTLQRGTSTTHSCGDCCHAAPLISRAPHRLQDTPVPFSGGMLSYASWFEIPPRQKQHFVRNNCCYRGFQPLHTFAVRVHTHTMGRRVFMQRSAADGGEGARRGACLQLQGCCCWRGGAVHRGAQQQQQLWQHAMQRCAPSHRAPPCALAAHAGPVDIIADGDPLQPQGFSPVASKTLWPGERLNVSCEFDSSDRDAPVSAGPDHVHEMCNMYLMVYSALPHLEMCSDGATWADEASPGNLRRGDSVVPDPYPRWAPPAPADVLRDKVRARAVCAAWG